MAVRTVTRRGARRLVIDIAFRHPDGTKGRYRHDAEVQTLAAARAEERRRLAALAATGSPYERPPGIDATPPPSPPPASPAASGPPKAEEPALPIFAEVVKRYRAEFAPTRLKPSTARNYGKVLDGFLVPRLGDLPIHRIDADVARRLDLEHVRRNTRSSTRRNVQTVLRSVLCRFAVEAGLLKEPPRMPRLPPIGVPEGGPGRVALPRSAPLLRDLALPGWGGGAGGAAARRARAPHHDRALRARRVERPRGRDEAARPGGLRLGRGNGVVTAW